jgi:hypothetical protein
MRNKGCRHAGNDYSDRALARKVVRSSGARGRAALRDPRKHIDAKIRRIADRV